MIDAFDLAKSKWAYEATLSSYLYGTGLAPLLPTPTAALTVPTPMHTAAWWAQQTGGMDLSAADRIDANAFNRILWRGPMVLPVRLSPEDLAADRSASSIPAAYAS
jgi:hypothetical protein